MKVGTSCCLDQNSNNICDKDEVIENKETKINISTIPKTNNDENITKVTIPTKEYGENQIAGCEEGYIQIGEGSKTTRDECYRYYAVKDENILYCEQINGESEKNYCYYTIATSKLNENICQSISTTTSNCRGIDERFSCKDNCYLTIAETKNSDYICESVTNQDAKNGCYFWIAHNTKNSNLCKKITTQSSEVGSDSCYYDIALQENNINICNPINDAYKHDACMLVIIRNLKLSDISICDKFKYVDGNGVPQFKLSCENEIETGKYL